MKHGGRGALLLAAALAVFVAALACGLPGRLAPTQEPAWTPAPLTAQPGQSRALPATAPVIAGPLPAAATPAIPLATTEPTAQPTAAPTAAVLPAAAATPDPHHVIVTESDIANVIAGGAVENAGVHVENLRVRFTQGKTWITADQVNYSLISVSNLAIVGTLVAQDGALQFETESVSPQGLVTAMIPGLVNQALKQYTSQWYVENVQTLEGRIELTIR